jgi:hypothetical protein
VGFYILFSNVANTKTDVGVSRLLWSFLFDVMALVILASLPNLITITYAAAGGHSKDLLEDMLFRMQHRIAVGALVGACLAWIMTDILLGMR